MSDKIRYLVINKINTDDDASYPAEKMISKMCETKEDVFLFINEIMASLKDATGHDYVVERFVKAYNDWKAFNEKNIPIIPDWHMGNQSIQFEIHSVKMDGVLTADENNNDEFNFYIVPDSIWGLDLRLVSSDTWDFDQEITEANINDVVKYVEIMRRPDLNEYYQSLEDGVEFLSMREELNDKIKFFNKKDKKD